MLLLSVAIGMHVLCFVKLEPMVEEWLNYRLREKAESAMVDVTCQTLP